MEGGEEFTPTGLNMWTEERLELKLANLAKVIALGCLAGLGDDPAAGQTMVVIPTPQSESITSVDQLSPKYAANSEPLTPFTSTSPPLTSVALSKSAL